eukprot:TRINITY_DN2170_c1_g1_i4.p1 TRINITY_DN2170_c1_g1~~TRINITY_DN2170_c1_g1_i4.p1  ORF type:complete len:370 (+),score=129.89 TRINITY_DN2170_c1_g1_i4:163-1272(+)
MSQQMQAGQVPGYGGPVYVLNATMKRSTGREAQLANIEASISVANIVRTCLGPRAMLKMMLDPIGGVAITNDGNAILREIDVTHPAAKSMIELARAQDEEVQDGTTSVIILAGEMMLAARQFLEQQYHPRTIVGAYAQALTDALEILEEIAFDVDTDDDEQMMKIVQSSVGTKFVNRWADKMCQLAIDAVRTVYREELSGRKDIDVKRYAKVEKIPGGEIDECRVLSGVMLNKDITHSGMRRVIENPRIILLDCPLEYKKGESQIQVELTKSSGFKEMLKIEEDYIEEQCAHIIALQPDVVFTEKGVSDLAQHYLVKANITCIRRCRKTDNNRIARACGATIAHRPSELTEEDVGTGCGLFHVEKIGDE